MHNLSGKKAVRDAGLREKGGRLKRCGFPHCVCPEDDRACAGAARLEPSGSSSSGYVLFCSNVPKGTAGGQNMPLKLTPEMVEEDCPRRTVLKPAGRVRKARSTQCVDGVAQP